MLDDGVQVFRLNFELFGGRKAQQVAHDGVGPFHRVTHIRQDHRDRFVVVGNVLGQISQAHEDGLQGILDLMGHAGRQGSHRFHFFGLDQLQLRRLQLLVRSP